MRLVSAALLLVIAGLSAVSAQGTNEFVGTYRIDIPGKVSTTTTRERIDSRTVQRTDSTTIGKGVQGAGRVEIKADGTYAIHDHIGYGKLKAGRWIVNSKGPFSDKGGIKLLEVKSADYGEDQRAWYVFVNSDGELEAREPPYTTYNSLRLTKTSGAKVTGPVKTNTPAAAKPPVIAKKHELSQAEIYKLQDEIRAFFMGKTLSQIEAVLGKAKSKNDPDGYSQDFSLENAELPIENFPGTYKTITVQFNAPPARGGTVKNVNINVW